MMLLGYGSSRHKENRAVYETGKGEHSGCQRPNSLSCRMARVFRRVCYGLVAAAMRWPAKAGKAKGAFGR